MNEWKHSTEENTHVESELTWGHDWLHRIPVHPGVQSHPLRCLLHLEPLEHDEQEKRQPSPKEPGMHSKRRQPELNSEDSIKAIKAISTISCCLASSWWLPNRSMRTSQLSKQGIISCIVLYCYLVPVPCQLNVSLLWSNFTSAV